MLDLNVVLSDLRKEIMNLENAIHRGETVSLPLLNIKYSIDSYLEELDVIKPVEKEEGNLEGGDPFKYVTISGREYAFVNTNYKLVWYVHYDSDSKWTQLADSTLNVI